MKSKERGYFYLFKNHIKIFAEKVPITINCKLTYSIKEILKQTMKCKYTKIKRLFCIEHFYLLKTVTVTQKKRKDNHGCPEKEKKTKEKSLSGADRGLFVGSTALQDENCL